MTSTHRLLRFLSTYQQIIASNVVETMLQLNCSFTYACVGPVAFMSQIPTVGRGTFQALQPVQKLDSCWLQDLVVLCFIRIRFLSAVWVGVPSPGAQN